MIRRPPPACGGGLARRTRRRTLRWRPEWGAVPRRGRVPEWRLLPARPCRASSLPRPWTRPPAFAFEAPIPVYTRGLGVAAGPPVLALYRCSDGGLLQRRWHPDRERARLDHDRERVTG